jgi:predicted nucleotidyltransferase
MSKPETIKIVRKFAKKLKQEKFPFSSIYFFGSRARGTNHKDSDIDVAVISPRFRNRFGRNYEKLRDFRDGIDDRIECHAFTAEDFKNNADPLAYEIRKTGIKIV